MSNTLTVYFTVGNIRTDGPQTVAAATFKYFLDQALTQPLGSAQFGASALAGSPVKTGVGINFGAGLSGSQAYQSIQYVLASTTPFAGAGGTLALVSALVNDVSTIAASGNAVTIPNAPQSLVCTKFNLQYTPTGASSAIAFQSSDPESKNQGQ